MFLFRKGRDGGRKRESVCDRKRWGDTEGESERGRGERKEGRDGGREGEMDIIELLKYQCK